MNSLRVDLSRMTLASCSRISDPNVGCTRTPKSQEHSLLVHAGLKIVMATYFSTDCNIFLIYDEERISSFNAMERHRPGRPRLRRRSSFYDRKGKTALDDSLPIKGGRTGRRLCEG